MMFTNKEKHAALLREIAFRKYVYPKRVAALKMSQPEADKQIAVMEQIAEDYLTLVNQNELPF